MDVPDGELDHLKPRFSLTDGDRDVARLKQLHEKNTIAYSFNLSESVSEPILTQDLSEMMDTLELYHSQQTNSSTCSGPVLPQDLVDCAHFDELILEYNEDTLSQCLNQENLNSISQVLNKLEEHTDESEDLTQEHKKPVPRPQLSQTFMSSGSKISPKRDNLEDIRDFVDEYWTTKSRELFST